MKEQKSSNYVKVAVPICYPYRSSYFLSYRISNFHFKLIFDKSLIILTIFLKYHKIVFSVALSEVWPH